MKDGNTKRRDAIKNFAIVFLSILLLLTFFSNTIMNYSLPEVAYVYVQSNTITTRVRGSAMIEASDPYSVIAGESRTINSVAVKVGMEVAKDDVIYYLDEKESAELLQAEAELNEMELSFMQRLLSGDIRSSVINKVDAGDFGSYADLRDRLIAGQTNEKAAENQIETLQRNVRDMQKRLVSLGVPSGDQVALKDELVLKVEDMEVYISKVISGIFEAYGEIPVFSSDDALRELRTKATLKKLLLDGRITKEQHDASWKAMDGVLAQYNDSVTALGDAIRVAENNLIVAQLALRDAEERFGKVSDNRSDIIADIQAELTFHNLVEQIEKKRSDIDKIKEKSTGAAITAPVAGLIVSLNHVAGETTVMGNAVAVIQVAGKGFTASFTVSNEQASRVKVGDPAEVSGNWWWNNDLAVTLTGIRPNANNPGQSKDLLFTVTGSDVQAGQQINISVGARSAQYDLTVPNSAIREDNNSKFILIVEARNTPISNRYYATRVDVEVIAEDDNNSAITAPLYGWEYVITTATKPVAAGQQIRLAN